MLSLWPTIKSLCSWLENFGRLKNSDSTCALFPKKHTHLNRKSQQRIWFSEENVVWFDLNYSINGLPNINVLRSNEKLKRQTKQRKIFFFFIHERWWKVSGWKRNHFALTLLIGAAFFPHSHLYFWQVLILSDTMSISCWIIKMDWSEKMFYCWHDHDI